MRVVVSREAEDDVRSILHHISQDSIRVAMSMVDRLEAAMLVLTDGALHHPLLANREESGFRRRVVGPYGIFYRVEGQVVNVVRVLHSARNHERILFPED